MAGYSSIENFVPIVNDKMLEKAEFYKKKLAKKTIKPLKIIKNIVKNDDVKKPYSIGEVEDITFIEKNTFKEGGKFIVDFGDHYVGNLKFTLKSVGSPPDAPAYIKVKLGEIIDEIAIDSSTYNGWISRSWIQEEYIHVDLLPNEIDLGRRYAFRYVEFTVIATSAKYSVKFENIEAEAVSQISFGEFPKLKNIKDENFTKLDKVGLKTLQDSMQDVYEDGPKRDRRLWLGDLKLQALANYESFNDMNLIKRCLYLFAGSKLPSGAVGACLFTEPKITVDDTFLIDYSLIFISTLFDYYEKTKDRVVLDDLWEVCWDQILVSQNLLNEKKITNGNKEDFWAFIDWNDELEKNASVQGVYIYCYKQALQLAKTIEDTKKIEQLESYIKELEKAAIENYWDEEKQFFVSGPDKQVSWHSQIWLVLANVFDKEKNKNILNNLIFKKPSVKPKTPYAYHYLIEALFQNDLIEKGIEILNWYWGEMVRLGADTYWEAFDPEDPYFSPYGSSIINSYCHAWSCAPTFFIRKYLDK